MKTLLWFLFGILTACVAAFTFLIFGTGGFSARNQPSGLEQWLAVRIRMAAVPAASRNLRNPVSDSPEVQAEARAHWADHCTFCHAADGSGDTEPGRNTWPPSPDMRAAEIQNETDGELFYAIQNGVRFTAMPAWGSDSDHDAESSWKLVRFIRQIPRLSPEEKAQIRSMTPRTPAELKEEQEEEKFLKGEEGEPHTHTHSH